MDRETVKQFILSMPVAERQLFLREVQQECSSHKKVLSTRRNKLDNKQGKCPHCGNFKYSKYGTDKGSKRYKCKNCNRTFTEYSGTWMARIHKKHLLEDYIKLMEEEEKSLDKIKDDLGISKQTAFDWRHKILSGFEHFGKGNFEGITESDDTFFLVSEKGSKNINRPSRKRVESAKKRGINNEHVAVLVTVDRVSEIDLTVARLGRIKKQDIEQAIGDRVSEQTILCSDSHVTYKGFAMDK